MSTPVSTETPGGYEGWTILELMGHRRLAGYVREVVIAGAGFLRLDVPSDVVPGFVATQFYPPSSVYCMTPVTETVARAVAAIAQPEPATRWELQTAKPGTVVDAEPHVYRADDPDPEVPF